MKIENWQRHPFKRSLKWNASCYEYYCKRDSHRECITIFNGSNYSWKKVIRQSEKERQRIDYYRKIDYNRDTSLWIIKVNRVKSYLARKRLKRLLTEEI